MRFYDTSNTYLSLVHETWALCDADINSYPLADVTRRVNFSLEELVGMIINADGDFQFDDTNHTDLPVGTGTLIEGQQAYSFASEYLQIEQISIKNSSGDWVVIDPIDPSNFRDIEIDEYYGSAGMPVAYDIIGDTIKLYPSPTSTAVTLTSGLKVRFKRTVDLFTTADTSQEPGLPSTHHVILAYMAAIPYCASYKKDRIPWLEKKVDDMKKTLLQHYAHRQKDQRKIMTMKGINFI